jgi:hypothetical protein
MHVAQGQREGAGPARNQRDRKGGNSITSLWLFHYTKSMDAQIDIKKHHFVDENEN